PGPKALAASPAGKGKPAPKKPGAAPSAAAPKPAGKIAIKPASKPAANPAAKPAVAVKPAQPKPPKPAKPAKVPKPPPILNKGALAAKDAAARRVAEAAKVAAEKAEAEAKLPRKLVPATANAIRPGAAKLPPPKGKAAQRPPAEVRPLGVLPPESMAKARPPIAPGTRPNPPLAPVRPQSMNVRPGDSTGLHAKASAGQAARGARGDERVSDADLKHFETRLLEERARIMREMG